jgi:hypothetical protein
MRPFRSRVTIYRIEPADRDELMAMGKRAARKLKWTQILLAADGGCRDVRTTTIATTRYDRLRPPATIDCDQ